MSIPSGVLVFILRSEIIGRKSMKYMRLLKHTNKFFSRSLENF